MRLRFRFAFWRQRHGLPNLGHVRRGTSLTWWRALIWPYPRAEKIMLGIPSEKSGVRRG